MFNYYHADDIVCASEDGCNLNKLMVAYDSTHKLVNYQTDGTEDYTQLTCDVLSAQRKFLKAVTKVSRLGIAINNNNIVSNEAYEHNKYYSYIIGTEGIVDGIKAILSKIKEFFVKLWNWVKRMFGFGKTAGETGKKETDELTTENKTAIEISGPNKDQQYKMLTNIMGMMDKASSDEDPKVQKALSSYNELNELKNKLGYLLLDVDTKDMKSQESIVNKLNDYLKYVTTDSPIYNLADTVLKQIDSIKPEDIIAETGIKYLEKHITSNPDFTKYKVESTKTPILLNEKNLGNQAFVELKSTLCVPIIFDKDRVKVMILCHLPKASNESEVEFSPSVHTYDINHNLLEDRKLYPTIPLVTTEILKTCGNHFEALKTDKYYGKINSIDTRITQAIEKVTKELSKLDESSFTHDQQIVYNYYLKLLRVLGEAYALTIKNIVSGITSDVMSYVKISIGVFKLVGVETETPNNIAPSEYESPKPKESIFGKVKNIFSKKN